ncbi:MAG: NAD(P)H-dependent oxidoreductase subunit E [Deltaproteobacteria bacterium]|nr:NAD(P)H-dependent oxidoreductase subunit E [Deltaproteobacteria bacterium]
MKKKKTLEAPFDPAPVEAILSGYPAEEPSLVQVLLDVQEKYNYLPRDALKMVAQALSVPLAKVHSVATFYKTFSLDPQGRHLVHVCMGTACHIRGAGQLMEEAGRRLDLDSTGTTKDMEYTIKTVNCVGACALAPVVIVDGRYHGKTQPNNLAGVLGLGKGEGRHAE